MIELQKQLLEITTVITKLIINLKQSTAAGNYFVNALCEDIFIGTFNKIFDTTFKNQNYGKPNAAAVDLIDEKGKILIQVTSDGKPAKLYDTLAKWSKHKDDYIGYEKLYHFVVGKKRNYRQPEIDKRLAGSGLNFNQNDDVIDVYTLVRLLREKSGQGMSMADLIDIKERLEQSISGFEFKHRKLTLGDRGDFTQTNYIAPDTTMLDRRVVQHDTRIEMDIKDIFNEPSMKYVQLVSAAGLGKSVALNDLFEFYFENAKKETGNITPYILNFKDINSKVPLKSQILPGFSMRKNPLLLIDGLDEIVDEYAQTNIEKNLYGYLAQNPGVRCLVSGRFELKLIGNDAFKDIRFTKHNLKKLTDEQVDSYLVQKTIFEEIKVNRLFSSIRNTLRIPFNLYHVSEYFDKHRRLENTVTLIIHKRINEDLGKINQEPMLVLKTRLFLEKLSVVNNLVNNKNFSARDIGKALRFDSDAYEMIKNVRELSFEPTTETFRFNNNSKFTEDILAAYYFQDRDYETFVSFFQLGKGNVNIPQSWYNAISMLLSIKGIDSSFSKKIIDNYPFILVNAEDFGLTETQKSGIFQDIFETYERKNIWLDRTMYDENRLVNFADNSATFSFLIEKIKSIDSNFRTRSMALSLLSKFEVTEQRVMKGYYPVFQVIDSINTKGDQVPQAFHCLTDWSEHISEDQKRTIIEKSEKSTDEYLRYNQHVRAAVYRFIEKNHMQDLYLDYLLDGLRLLDKYGNQPKHGRSEVSLMDESYFLELALINIQNSKIIIKAASEIINYFPEYDRYHAFNVLEKLIKKLKDAIDGKKNNKLLIRSAVKIFSEFKGSSTDPAIWYRWKETITDFKLDAFILDTLKAESEILDRLINGKTTFLQTFNLVCDLIAKLLTDNSYSVIIQAIETGKISLVDAVYLHDILMDDKQEIKDRLRVDLTKLAATFPVRTKKPTAADLAIFQRSKFDLMFDAKKYIDDILTFFSKSDIIKSDIYDNADWYDGPFYYSDPRLDFLRQHLKFMYNTTLSKQKVESLLDRTNLQDVLIEEIFRKLKASDYELTQEQKQFLLNWLATKIEAIDFRIAITDVHHSRFSITQNANNIFRHANLLGFQFNKKTSLDLLSFENIENISSDIEERYKNYFEYLIAQIDDIAAVKERVQENLAKGIDYFPVLSFHIIFSIRYSQTKNIPLIENNLNRLKAQIQADFSSDNPLLVYYAESNNFEFLKAMIPDTPNEFFWKAIDLIRENGQNKNDVEEILTSLYAMEQEESSKLEIATKMIANNIAESLSKYVSSLLNTKISGTHHNFSFFNFRQSIDKYTHVEIDAAITLLELTYRYHFDGFENPRGIVMIYLQNLIKFDKDLFDVIWKKLEEFIDQEKGKIENVQFLEIDMKSLKEAYFSFYKSNFSFKQAFELVEQHD